MIQPDFAPGRGWHKIDGLYSPGSETDLEKRRERAWPCWVLRMREKGLRIAPDLLLEVEPIPGLFLATEAAWRLRQPDSPVNDEKPRHRPVRASGGAVD